MTITVPVDTVLPEVAYLAAQNGDVTTLNALADFSDYFGRDDILRFGERVFDGRMSSDDSDPENSVASISAACERIGASARGVAIKSSTRPALTALYFESPAGIAELCLVGERVVVTSLPGSEDLASLVQRHIESDTGQVFVVHHETAGRTRYLAARAGRYAYSDDGSDWREGPDQARDRSALVTQFLAERQ